MNITLFEDEFVPDLYPITIGRPAFAISCGAYRLIDGLQEFSLSARAIVRPHLRGVLAADYPALARDEDPRSWRMYVNARAAPSMQLIKAVRSLSLEPLPGVVRNGDSIALAALPPGSLPEPEGTTPDTVSSYLHEAAKDLEPINLATSLWRYPHDIIRSNLELLEENLNHRLQTGAYDEVRDGVYLAADAELGDYVVTDTSDGPIVLEEGATIGPYCFLSGPAHLGARARVIEHAAIKDAVSIGHTTKIGGEVEASVIEPYTNKQHYGFLGHSYLGSWINLGAGTCNSDLKNTYGIVNLQYGNRKVSSNMQFVGCIMGDYAKSAINTGIFTGKTIGACSMLYGFITENVPSFVNYARLFGQVAELPPEVMVATQQRMFQRRNVKQRDCDQQLLHDMFHLTRAERENSPGAPLSL